MYLYSVLVLEGGGNLLTFRPLFPRSKHPLYSLNCRLGVLHNDYGHFGEKKIILSPVLTELQAGIAP